MINKIITRIWSVLLIVILFTKIGYAAELPVCPVIPMPVKLEMTGGTFVLQPETKILVKRGSPEIMAIGAYLAGKLKTATGYEFTVEETSDANARLHSILLTTLEGDKSLGEEGYKLVVDENSVLIQAPSPCGLFWGVQTIRQLLPVEIEGRCLIQKEIDWTIPCLKIEDVPRYQWRGLMIDCSRTFLTKEYLKRYIDLLAYYKMNRFHLHLTDDQGWRVEIKRYPKLTEVGAWGVKKDGKSVGGFYSQEDIREIVTYAKSRYVMIVPEIEMPGHSAEVAASYPELSCKPGQYKTLTLPVTKLYREASLCAGKEITYEFMENVISEVVDLFPSPYFHIGADECVKDNWKECPHCQKKIQNEGLRDEYELQSYFVKRIEKILNSKNRRLVGWDEILEGGLAPNAVVMFWRAFKGRGGLGGGQGIDIVLESARTGHDVIMTPTSHCYLDYTHTRISLEKAYLYEPTPPELTHEQAKHILGVQGNMWTHLATLEPQIDAQIFPRIIALAEVGWSPKEMRNWEDFSNRMQNHYQRLDLMRVNYYKYTDYVRR